MTRYGGANGGNGLRQADSEIQDEAVEREVEAQDNTETFQSHTQDGGRSFDRVSGWDQEDRSPGRAQAALRRSASLAAVDDLHQATGRDLNLVVGQKLNATVGGDLQEQIQGLRKSVAGGSQRLQAPKTWLGSEGVNVLQVLCDLLAVVKQMNIQLASHTHGPTPVPSNAAVFSVAATTTQGLNDRLSPITA